VNVDLKIMPGTPGLELEDVAHVLVPGRGRNGTGSGLTAEGLDRIAVARGLYDQVVAPHGGRLVCSGYRSPIDHHGGPWSTEEVPGRTYVGVPEADLMRDELLRRGVPLDAVHVERESIDTVTNLLRSELEGHFGDDRPVAIVAQPDHLRRIIAVIAPRTLRRPFLGFEVPQEPPQAESPLATVVSRLVLARLPEQPDAAIAVATARARRIWKIVEVAGKRSYK
jgi:hypothetical protein